MSPEKQRQMRNSVPTGVQIQFDTQAAKTCPEMKHFLSRHLTCEGDVHIRHNEACLPIDQADIDNPNVNIWGTYVLPWIEEQHHLSSVGRKEQNNGD